MISKSYFTIGESNERLELTLPLYVKKGGRSNHFTIGAEHHDMVTIIKDNFIFANVCFSSLSDILRSIDTFTMLCSFLKNPFVVTAYYKSNATKIQAKSIRLDYNLKQNFNNTNKKRRMNELRK